MFVMFLGGVSLPAQQTLPDAPQPQNNVPAGRPAAGSPSSAAPAPTTAPPASTPNIAPVPRTPSAPSSTLTPGAGQTLPSLAEQVPPEGPAGPREELYRFVRDVSFVTIPVTVKDESGHLVQGLTRRDFAVYENGQAQTLTFFTSDPFPLSAAVVINTNLSSSDWNKVKDTLSALVGAFSQYDEVSIFTYGNTVQKVQEFTTVNTDKLAQTVRVLKTRSGSGFGPPVAGGTAGAGYPTPTVNGRRIDPSTPDPSIATVPKESYVLNDAILAAAQELTNREQENRGRHILPTRKILFVISDGRELGSNASYADVLKVLLTRQISLYAVGIGSGIPGYRQAQRIRIPGQGYGDILPKYASATGGQVYGEASQHAIEDAYSRVTEEARSQYTLGYRTPTTPSSTFRTIEVRVHRPHLRVHARDGYYPLPPAR